MRGLIIGILIQDFTEVGGCMVVVFLSSRVGSVLHNEELKVGFALIVSLVDSHFVKMLGFF